MRIFVTEEFEDFMKVARLSDSDIKKSAIEVNNGLFDADLGDVLKKHIVPKELVNEMQAGVYYYAYY